jgi:hypothetical protein
VLSLCLEGDQGMVPSGVCLAPSPGSDVLLQLWQSETSHKTWMLAARAAQASQLDEQGVLAAACASAALTHVSLFQMSRPLARRLKAMTKSSRVSRMVIHSLGSSCSRHHHQASSSGLIMMMSESSMVACTLWLMCV